ncbi:helix-turn-helix domain-containing protein [Streptomyces sp. NPDC093707]|uniref:helix-turn-helix domain-containing protein n=1 Tax=Streptomyces sp. NPDC093707 TaxID=3154984 RepID=UPI00344CEC2E
MAIPEKVWHDSTVRQALAEWDFGQVSRLVRQRSSLRQEDVAHLTGLSQAYLSMVESGSRKMNHIDKITQFLAGLGAPAGLVTLPLPHRAVPPAKPETYNPLEGDLDPTLPWTADRMVAALNAAVGGGNVERRKFLSVSGLALTALVHQWGAEEAEPLERAAKGGKVSAKLLTSLQGTTDELRIADASAGSGTVAQLGRTHIELLKLIIEQSTYDSTTGQALAAILADTTTQTGWFYFDSGEEDRAQACFIAALRAAKASGDIRLGAGALSYMAIHAYSTGAPKDAVTAARAAREKAKGINAPALEAMLLTRQARGHSKLGERQQAYQALGEASELCAQGRSENDPHWLYWINEGEIHGQAGSCYLDLNDPGRAAISLGRAQDALNPADLRTRGLFLSRTATAHIRDGDAEAGVAAAHAAMDLAECLNSARLATHVHSVVHELHPLRHTSYARDLIERAQTVQA